jgi:hypothetical protein
MMSAGSINGIAHSLGDLLGRLSRQGPTRSTTAPSQSGEVTGSNTSTHESEEIHGRHHHDHGGGKRLFTQIQSAVTSALAALPTDGAADPNQAIVQAITQVFKDNGISLPSSSTSSTTGQTTDGSTTGTTTTDTTTPTGTETTTETPGSTTTPATTETQPPTTPPAPGTTDSTGNTDDSDGDDDHHGEHHWRTGNANSAAHSARQAFFQALQRFGITPQQFRQDLLQALKDALNGSPADTTATDPLPPGSAVDVTT